LGGYALLDAPITDKTPSPDMLAEHLKTLCQAVASKARTIVLTLGVNETVVRPVEVPRMPLDELRAVLKHNSKAYLQQDLSGYVFDCIELPASAAPNGSQGPIAPAKQRVLLAGVKQQVVDDFTAGAKSAGLILESLVPGLIGPVNAFELLNPELFNQEVAVLVDVGFRNSSICLLQKGQFVLSRVVALGGDRLTAALSEAMNITYPEAESLKIGMAHEVQFALESVLVPLGRELRASLDFFEHQQDTQITQVFVSGGTTRSELLVQTLQNELGVECKTWDPVGALQVEVSPDAAAQIEMAAPQLAVAIGAGLAAL